MQSKKFLIAALMSGWGISSMAAQQLTLTADHGVQGAFRYCEYSNGKTYWSDPAKPCAASIAEPAANGKGMGILRGVSQEGTNKLCVYRVASQDRTLSVDSNANCPLNQQFD